MLFLKQIQECCHCLMRLVVGLSIFSHVIDIFQLMELCVKKPLNFLLFFMIKIVFYQIDIYYFLFMIGIMVFLACQEFFYCLKQIKINVWVFLEGCLMGFIKQDFLLIHIINFFLKKLIFVFVQYSLITFFHQKQVLILFLSILIVLLE